MGKINWSWLCKIIGHNKRGNITVGVSPASPYMTIVDSHGCSRCNNFTVTYTVEVP